MFEGRGQWLTSRQAEDKARLSADSSELGALLIDGESATHIAIDPEISSIL